MVKLEVAYLGMQCFWGESAWAKNKGVRVTRVGYAGGESSNPTYQSIGDHTEITEVTFDPSIITYREILNFFWTHHNPAVHRKKQYQSAILYTSPEQKDAALETLEATKSKVEDVETYVKPLNVFYEAEAYHQKYWLRNAHDIFRELKLSDKEVATGVLATKLNAYSAGYQDFSELHELQKEYNLSDELVQKITDLAKRGGDPRACH
ncbi:unnamed protein product [Auanema sp. JU1783]|nr:unnamed protein product [Auanema sp. JU1783]